MRSLGAPISDIPLLITATIRPPTMAPTTLPTPPCTAAPPMNAAAMASSSNDVPAVGPAWLKVVAVATPGFQPKPEILARATATLPDLTLSSTRIE